MFTVYVIESENGKIYIGHTEDIGKRLQRHNELLPTKKKSYTYKQGGEWKVIYSEALATRPEAQQREKKLKNYRGREFIKQFRKPVTQR